MLGDVGVLRLIVEELVLPFIIKAKFAAAARTSSSTSSSFSTRRIPSLVGGLGVEAISLEELDGDKWIAKLKDAHRLAVPIEIHGLKFNTLCLQILQNRYLPRGESSTVIVTSSTILSV